MVYPTYPDCGCSDTVTTSFPVKVLEYRQWRYYNMCSYCHRLGSRPYATISMEDGPPVLVADPIEVERRPRDGRDYGEFVARRPNSWAGVYHS